METDTSQEPKDGNGDEVRQRDDEVTKEGQKISSAPGSGEESWPQRYAIRSDSEGRFLSCVEAPNVMVRIERGFTASAATVKKSPAGTIYLDGAAASEPFMDVQRRVYNLDHHEGCVRSFTLATCEQAMVMVLKGLDLRSGEWTVWANEPDLDTVLAIWVLVNHMRLSANESEVRQAIMPLLRLEGAIDANGLKFTELCGFPEDLHQKTSKLIEKLMAHELEVKGSGRWSKVDFLEFTSEVLAAIDAEFYPPRLLAETPEIDELQRVQITDQRMAVICRSQHGIYEVEKGLAHLHGNNVGLILLQKNPRTYTVRQVDPFLPISLVALYDRLNLTDPAIDGRDEANRWGGSAEIGGSPRKTGTALTPNDIARVCAWVYRPPTLLRRLGAIAAVVGTILGVAALALVGSFIYSDSPAALGLTSLASQSGRPLFGGIMTAFAVGLLLTLGWRHRRQYGLRMPVGWRWTAFLLAAPIGGLLGGPWAIPKPLGTGASALVLTILLPLVAEALHRGMLQGALVSYFNVQRPGGRWFFSRPVAISMALSATLSSGLILPALLAHPQVPGWLALTWVPGALIIGLACGMARERSMSLLPPALIHLLAAVWMLTLPTFV